ncbi:MAG TPA: enolase C-terminal domain-like protein [Acidimicrobiales bacterium]|nr:enolase C-terminal domain-like protein [Acidimicrobiales bacterium]
MTAGAGRAPLLIEQVAVELRELPPEPRFRWRAGLPGSEGPAVGGILRICSSDGAVGLAPTRRGAQLAELVERRLRDELVGQDAWQRELLWHRLWELDRREQIPSHLFGLVDVALWDLAGKVLDAPVHRLLGAFRDAIAACASTVTYDTDEEYLSVATQAVEAGYRAVKVHGRGDARLDAALCARLRSRLGDGVPLMYDASGAFDLPDAAYLGAALADLGFVWLEEPMREHSVTAYRLLAERVRVPLLVGETSAGAHLNIADFLAARCASYVRTGATLKGGVTGAMRIAHLAQSYLVRAEVHQSGPVSRHLCMAIPNTTYYESRVIGPAIEREPGVGPDGLVRAPSLPGFGFEEFLD